MSSQYTWKPRSVTMDHITEFKEYMATEYGINVRIDLLSGNSTHTDFELGPWPARIHRSGRVRVFDDAMRKDGARTVWACAKSPKSELEACKACLEELLTQDG